VVEQGVGLVLDDVLDVPVVLAYLVAMDILAEDTMASIRGMAEAAWELELEAERFQCCEGGLQTHLLVLQQYNPVAPIDRRDFLLDLLPQEIFLCLFE